jgi:phosphate transport system substrate-binding protein
MVNLVQEWAEAYHKVNADVTVEVAGGGSGVGISSLTQGITDIANSSRDMTKAEKEQAKQKTGKDVSEITVGYDGIAIYVHKDNPIQELTMEQLADIFGEFGNVRILPRARAAKEGLQTRIARHVRLQGCRGTGRAHGRRYRIQRHGV